MGTVGLRYAMGLHWVNMCLCIKTVHGQFEYTVEKENSKECVMECDVVRIRNMNNDSRGQNEIRSHRNMDLEKDGGN